MLLSLFVLLSLASTEDKNYNQEIITKMSKRLRQDFITKYLSFRDALNLGLTCKLFFNDIVMIKECENDSGERAIKQICKIDIPEIEIHVPSCEFYRQVKIFSAKIFQTKFSH